MLETKDLGPTSGGLRVRVSLAAEQTEQIEKVLGLQSYVMTPQTALVTSHVSTSRTAQSTTPGTSGTSTTTPRAVSSTPRNLNMMPRSAGTARKKKSVKPNGSSEGVSDLEKQCQGWVDGFSADGLSNLRPYVRPRDVSGSARRSRSSRDLDWGRGRSRSRSPESQSVNAKSRSCTPERNRAQEKTPEDRAEEVHVESGLPLSYEPPQRAQPQKSERGRRQSRSAERREQATEDQPPPTNQSVSELMESLFSPEPPVAEPPAAVEPTVCSYPEESPSAMQPSTAKEPSTLCTHSGVPAGALFCCWCGAKCEGYTLLALE